MKTFNGAISLIKNSRGCYILDTVKGCSGCNDKRPGGCYGDCYALRIANRYKLQFTNPIKRTFSRDTNQLFFMGFDDESHIRKIIKGVRAASMPFIRIGEMGDPSEAWAHTLEMCKEIARAGKPIVIISKHWKPMRDEELKAFGDMNIIFNTSVSALDDETEIEYRLSQYKRISDYCKSILRVVSCRFNLENEMGAYMNARQKALLMNANVLETAFRPSANNKLVIDKVILTENKLFNRAKMLVSLRDDKIYLGPCDKCPEMCGVNGGTN